MTGKPPRRPATLDGRQAAVVAVSDALAERCFATQTLRAARLAGRLAGREAALALQLAQGTLRHLVTIEHVLGRVAKFDPDRTPHKLRAVLATAAYQIIWMDRVPAHAAVDRAVELARGLVKGRSPGMVNAILRRLCGALAEQRVPWRRLNPRLVRVDWARACEFTIEVLPPAGDEHLAIAAGECLQRYGDLVARHGPERAEACAWASQATPVTVIHGNTLRIDHAAFAQHAGELFARAEFRERAAFVPSSVAVVNTPAFRDGLIFIQDTTAHAAAVAAQARPGERILDLCAAPGGKSIVMALQMGGEGLVLACDSDAERLQLVADNAQRLGLPSIRTHLLVGDRDDLSPDTQHFDAALVDVPCSNTGVIARRPEARLSFAPRKLAALVELQRKLLARAADRVRPGGRLVHSTCSLEPEENEGLVADFLAKNPDWQLARERTTLPAWGPSHADWRDGGYFALLTRRKAGS